MIIQENNILTTANIYKYTLDIYFYEIHSFLFTLHVSNDYAINVNICFQRLCLQVGVREECTRYLYRSSIGQHRCIRLNVFHGNQTTPQTGQVAQSAVCFLAPLYTTSNSRISLSAFNAYL